MNNFINLFLVFKLFISLTKADESAILCAFVAASNIILNDWNCSNVENRCSWTGITCDISGNITEIDLQNENIPGKLL